MFNHNAFLPHNTAVCLSDQFEVAFIHSNEEKKEKKQHQVNDFAGISWASIKFRIKS